MTYVLQVPLQRLGPKERLLLLCGSVKWIFIVNLPENVWIKRLEEKGKTTYT